MISYFDLPVFFVVFRETLETAIVVSVLLAVLKQSLVQKGHEGLRRRLSRQVRRA